MRKKKVRLFCTFERFLFLSRSHRAREEISPWLYGTTASATFSSMSLLKKYIVRHGMLDVNSIFQPVLKKKFINVSHSKPNFAKFSLIKSQIEWAGEPVRKRYAKKERKFATFLFNFIFVYPSLIRA